MEKIPTHVFQSVCEIIPENVKKRLGEYLYPEADFAPDDWFEQYIQTILSRHFFEPLFDAAEIRSSFYRKRQLNKKNWVKSLKMDLAKHLPNPIHEEMKVYQNILENEGADKIQSILPVQELSDLSEYRLQELDEWAKNKETHLTSYPYWRTQKSYQIEKAFETDIVFMIADYFNKNNYTGKWENNLDDRPNILSSLPWAIGTHTIPTSKGNRKTKRELYSEYEVGNETLIRSIIAPKDNEEVLYGKAYALDEKDSELIQFILGNRDERFYSEKKTTVDLKDLVSLLYGSDSNRSYDLVKERIRKISRYTIEVYIKSIESQKINREYIINFFQEIEFVKDEETGRVHVNITLSDRIHQSIIEKQTVQVYRGIKEKLQSPICKILIYPLQKERIECHANDKNYRRHLDYYFFSQRVRFRSKKFENNFKLIEEALEEFKQLNVLIHDYKKVKNQGYDITFIPLTRSEEQDYFDHPPAALIDG